MGSKRARTILRMVAGAYVGYLGYQMLTNKDTWNNGSALPIIFGFLFIAAAIFFVIEGFISLKKQSEEDAREAQELLNEEESTETEVPEITDETPVEEQDPEPDEDTDESTEGEKQEDHQ